MHDTIVIGAGPVGSYYASLNDGCLVIEQKKRLEVGEPVQCTGLVSRNIEEFVKIPKSIIRNKLHGAVIHSPNNSVRVERKNVAYIINRKKFDQYLLDKALENSKAVFGEQVKEYCRKKDFFQVLTDRNSYRCRKLVDASGPKPEKDFVMGLQVTAKMSHEPLAELFFGNKVCPGFFAWIVPENEEVCRVGVATGTPRPYLDRFLDGIGNPPILDWQGGIIPMHKPLLIDKGGAFLLGDRAGHVKATTGGGLVMGLKSAKILSESNDYVKEWNRKVGKELNIHRRIRVILNELTDKELDELLKIIKEIKPELEKHGDMDFPSAFLLKMLKPRALLFLARKFPALLKNLY